MAVFTTKFNLGDILYTVDSSKLLIESMGVREIHVISKSPSAIYSIPAPYISYRGSINGISTEVQESAALFLAEAQAQVLQLLSQRTSDITGMV